MALDPSIEALLWEYREMRQEVRELVTSMDTNMRTGILTLGAIGGWGLAKDERVLVIVPTLIFIFCMIHLIKVASAAIISIYCQSIANRLKAKLGAENILMDWEGGEIWNRVTGKESVVKCGFFLFFIPIIIIFVLLSCNAFLQWKWTLPLHLFEIIAAMVYVMKVIKYESPDVRSNFIEQYLKKIK